MVAFVQNDGLNVVEYNDQPVKHVAHYQATTNNKQLTKYLAMFPYVQLMTFDTNDKLFSLSYGAAVCLGQ